MVNVILMDFAGCEAAFRRKYRLDDHISDIHTGKSRFKCDWPGCEYQTCHHKAFKVHKMRHTGEKPHKCMWTDCEWSFRQQHQLKVHMLKHTGEQPFECLIPGCEKRFKTKQAMRFHVERLHKNVLSNNMSSTIN